MCSCATGHRGWGCSVFTKPWRVWVCTLHMHVQCGTHSVDTHGARGTHHAGSTCTNTSFGVSSGKGLKLRVLIQFHLLHSRIIIMTITVNINNKKASICITLYINYLIGL